MAVAFVRSAQLNSGGVTSSPQTYTIDCTSCNFHRLAINVLPAQRGREQEKQQLLVFRDSVVDYALSL